MDRLINKNRVIESFFNSFYVEAFFYAAACATIFCYGLFHWWLQYDQVLKPFFDIYPMIAMCVALFFVLKRGKIEFDMALCLLMQTMVLVAVLDYHNEGYYEVRYAWMLPTAYIFGKCLARNDMVYRENRILGIYLALAGGMFLCTLMDFRVNWTYGENGWGYGTEMWNTFESGLPQPRTTYELGFVLVTAFMAYAIINARRKKILFFITVCLNLLIQYMVIKVDGRENRILLILVVPVCVTIYIIHGIVTKRKKAVVFALALFSLIVIGAIVFFIMFKQNRFGLYDKYLSSNWSAGGGIFTNVRFEINISAFKNMLRYPLDDYYYYAGERKAHSMVLEYGRVYGLTTYIGMTMIRLLFIKDALLFLFNKRELLNIKMLLFTAFTYINIYYSFEPNGFQRRYFWMIGLLISGLIRGRLIICRENKRLGSCDDREKR